MAWTGFNNGVIEFTRSGHGMRYGLTDRKVFERARRDVLATGLVSMTRKGGRNLAATYMLTNVELQASPIALNLRGLEPPTTAEILGGLEPPIEHFSGGLEPPNRGSTTPKEFGPHIKNARASDLRKEKCIERNAKLITVVNSPGAHEEAGQMEERREWDDDQRAGVVHGH
jgi:hypothetical protein